MHAQQVPVSRVATVAAGVPLRINVTRTARLRIGEPVEGTLTAPVFVGDEKVLATGIPVRGHIFGYAPVAKKVRTEALLNGDVTPLHDPIVEFEIIFIDGRPVPFLATAQIRTTQFVSFVPSRKKPSLLQQAKVMVHGRVKSVQDAILAPGKGDRALRLLYGQLPYHPQRLWTGTSLIADMNAPAEIPVLAPQPSGDAAPGTTLDRLSITARLVTPLSSDTSAKSESVDAIVTEPVLNAEHQAILPEGTHLHGTVLQSHPSRSFGRNGQLHFAFQSIERVGAQRQTVYGTLTGAAGAKGQNITVNSEGAVKSEPDSNRFVAPLLLGILALHGQDHDRDGSNLGGQTLASNGFGLIARVVTLSVADANVATGFGAYAFAKSIYFRFLTRGHPVTFAKDTLITVQLSAP